MSQKVIKHQPIASSASLFIHISSHSPSSPLQVFWWRHLYHHPRHWCSGDGVAAQWAQDNHHRSGETESAGLRPQSARRHSSVPGPPHHQHSHQGRCHRTSHRYGQSHGAYRVLSQCQAHYPKGASLSVPHKVVDTYLTACRKLSWLNISAVFHIDNVFIYSWCPIADAVPPVPLSKQIFRESWTLRNVSWDCELAAESISFICYICVQRELKKQRLCLCSHTAKFSSLV